MKSATCGAVEDETHAVVCSDREVLDRTRPSIPRIVDRSIADAARTCARVSGDDALDVGYLAIAVAPTLAASPPAVARAWTHRPRGLRLARCQWTMTLQPCARKPRADRRRARDARHEAPVMSTWPCPEIRSSSLMLPAPRLDGARPDAG